MTDREQRVIGGDYRLASRSHEPGPQRIFSFSNGSLTATVEIGTVEGNWEPVGFEVRTYPAEGRGRFGQLTARALRKVPFGALVDEALILLTEDLKRERAAAGPEARLDDDGHHTVNMPAASARVGLSRLKGPGRPQLTFHQLEEDAEFYNARAQVSRHPTRDLAEHIGIERSGAAKRVQRARAAGLIPPYRRRRAAS